MIDAAAAANGIPCPLKHRSLTCLQAPSEPDHRCIMHSASPGKDPDLFWRGVRHQIAQSDFDFSGYVFPVEASFLGETFADEANFSETVFCVGALFDGVTFSRGVSFRGARFDGPVTFCEMTFIQPWTEEAPDGGPVQSRSRTYASFDKVHFRGVHFVQTVFLDPVSFSQAVFSDQARFETLRFGGTTLFTDALFSSGATFRGVAFANAVEFQGARFGGLTLFEGVRFRTRAVFASADLQNVTFRSVDLRHCYFADSHNLDKAEFDHITHWAQWPPRSFRRLREFSANERAIGAARARRRFLWTRLKDSLEGHARVAIADEAEARADRDPATRPRALASAERAYRALRASYEAARDHPRVSGFYVAEMEMRRLASSPRRLGQAVGSLTAWYGLSSGYGERWERALGWFIGVWLLWAVFYLGTGLWIKIPGMDEAGVSRTHVMFVGLGSSPGGGKPAGTVLERYAHALLHSFLVATLLGRDVYGQPVSPLGHAVQAVESILGPLLLSLMVLAVRRRFHR